MKKLWYFAMALGLVACQTENVDVNGGKEAGDAVSNYMHVSLVSNAATRAVEDAGNYEDGTNYDENIVNNVRFYFFNGNAPFVVADGKSYSNYQIDGSEKDMPNVERILEATIVIDTRNGDNVYPTSVVAILNPTAAVVEKNYALDELSEVIAQVPLDASAGFVMSNSVYYDDATKQVVIAAPVTAENLATTEEAAKAHPVTIYVERTVAKVGLEVEAQKISDGIYDTGIKYTNAAGQEKSIYVNFLGWNVTGAADRSNLLKSINEAWPANLFKTGASGTDEPWNYAPYHRSFWAINPTGLGYLYDDFYAAKAKTFAQTAYVRENAAQNTAGDNNSIHTQVIIAGQLVDDSADHKPLEVAELAGVKYYGADGEAEAALKNAYANFGGVYKYKVSADGSGSKTEVKKIEPEDLQIVTVSSFNDEGQVDSTKQGRYYVYAKLANNAGEGYDGWTKNPNADTFNAETDAIETDEVEEHIHSWGHSKVWKGGYTYYYFDIRHLANPTISATKPTPGDEDYESKMAAYKLALAEAEATPGYYGVVRNHVYKCKVTSIFGLGTPVYDPDETIYPEHPEEEDTIIAAEIRILSWRIVNHSYDLDWSE